MNQNLPKRKPLRWDKCDYSTEGRYFITICTQGRKPILSRIHVAADVPDGPERIELLPFGNIANRCLLRLHNFYDSVALEQYVIMPNHIHFILSVSGSGASRTSPPTMQHSDVSRFISTFKRFSNKEYGNNIWQRSFFDRVIRNREEYEKIQKYIYENPLKWKDDDLYVE